MHQMREDIGVNPAGLGVASGILQILGWGRVISMKSYYIL